MQVTENVTRLSRVAFGLASLLAVLALYNLVTGVPGGAIVSSVGVVVATLIGVLSN